MLNITRKQDGSALTLILEGRIDTSTAPDFQTEVEPLPAGLTRLTLDCEKLNYISSAGLRVLLAIVQEMEEKGAALELCHVDQRLRDLFDITGFLDILTIV